MNFEMKFFIGFLIAIVALGANCLPTASPESSETSIPTWKWNDVKPDDLDVKPSVEFPEAHPKRDPKGRIYNGREITAKELADFKFQVRLIAHKKDGLSHCGGSIIAPNVVLTAAHCVEGATEMEVYFGVRDLNDITAGKAQSQKVDASAFRKPKTWNPVSLVDDIALIILKNNIKFSETVGQIALPPSTDTCAGYVGTSITISGWGKINAMGDRSDILRTSIVDVAKPADCKTVHSWLFNDKMICADASKSTGTCQGDSGGPITKNNGGKLSVIGVVSFGTKNCATTEPRVFTCVAVHLPWIQANMK